MSKAIFGWFSVNEDGEVGHGHEILKICKILLMTKNQKIQEIKMI